MEHDGHRQRLRERFAKDHFDAFHPHEVLELLLTYAIPRRDTNPLAHRLLDHFGSLHAVLEATPEELMQISGIGEQAATLLSMMVPLYRKYEESRLMQKRTLSNYRQLQEYCISLFRGRENECIYVLSLNPQLELLSTDMICEGTPGKVPVNLRMLVSLVLRRNASGIVLTHNHPGGSLIPSQADVDLTQSIARALEAVEVRLLDHVLVCGSNATSFKESGLYIYEADSYAAYPAARKG